MSGVLSVQFNEYSNLKNLADDGDCCDYGCSDCDPYFIVQYKSDKKQTIGFTGKYKRFSGNAWTKSFAFDQWTVSITRSPNPIPKKQLSFFPTISMKYALNVICFFFI